MPIENDACTAVDTGFLWGLWRFNVEAISE